MNFTTLVFDIGALSILLILILFLWWIHHSRSNNVSVDLGPAKFGLAYECSCIPLSKAKKSFVSRFPELNAILERNGPEDINLVRFGLFNLSNDALITANILKNVEIIYPAKTLILSATFGEALKTEPKFGKNPIIDGCCIQLPLEPMNPRSTLIYNFVLRGSARPKIVSGETTTHGSIRRVS